MTTENIYDKANIEETFMVKNGILFIRPLPLKRFYEETRSGRLTDKWKARRHRSFKADQPVITNTIEVAGARYDRMKVLEILGYKAEKLEKEVIENVISIAVSDLVLSENLHPRNGTDKETVDDLKQFKILDPIIVNQRNEIVDGWHRVEVAKQKNQESVSAIVRECKTDLDTYRMAIEENTRNRRMLTMRERAAAGLKLYDMYMETGKSKADAKKLVADVMGVDGRTMRRWSKDVDEANKVVQISQIAPLLEEGETQSEIADIVGVSQKTVSRFSQIGQMSNLTKRSRELAEREEKIKALHAQGKSRKEIRKITGFSKSPIDRCFQKLKTSGEIAIHRKVSFDEVVRDFIKKISEMDGLSPEQCKLFELVKNYTKDPDILTINCDHPITTEQARNSFLA